MRKIHIGSTSFLGIALVVLLGICMVAFGQAPTMMVTATAGAPSPNPACVEEQVSAAITALLSNPPSSGSSSTTQGPTWFWSLQAVQYRATSTDSWATADSNSYWGAVSQPSASAPDATLTAAFSVGGYYKATIQATVQYTNSLNEVVNSASGAVDILLTVVEVGFMPSNVGVAVGSSMNVTANITPSDYSGAISYAVDDASVATLSGSTPNFIITGQNLNETILKATLGSGSICGSAAISVFTYPSTCAGP